MKIARRFTESLGTPFADQAFVPRSSETRDLEGAATFRHDDIAVPEEWSQTATDVLAQKYFRRAGVDKEGGGERDARQVFHRLAGCWTDWGKRYGYFDGPGDEQAFYDEVAYMLSHQMAAPNSPQWFNTGLHWAYGIDGPAQGHYYAEPLSGDVVASTSAYEHPQPHACFIQSVQDDLVNENGVMDLWVREARLFKYGSGTGTNFSAIRGEGEPLSGGGRSSGLMSFLKVGDRAAGAIKSGGTTRRAAKMVCLDLDHPEIESFISWKVLEEQKVSAMVAGARVHREHLAAVMNACHGESTPNADPKTNPRLKKTLAAARRAHIPDAYLAKVLQLASLGHRDCDFPLFDTDWQGKAYETVSGQNSNNSVRIPNTFFAALDRNEEWKLVRRSDGRLSKKLPARALWDQITEAAWASADPGVQYDTTINEWHTCPEGGPIRGSNPCSEFMFLDDTACNLASLNLLKFFDEERGELRLDDFRHACRLWTVVLEISVLMAQYPSRRIAQRSYEYRPLGLGYSNLGALVMSLGLPYGSARARAICGALTAVMTGEAYATSAELAARLGPFAKYSENRTSMLRVVRNHRRAAYGAPAESYEGLSTLPESIDETECPPAYLQAARDAWDRALSLGEAHGYRNSQVTVLAPTGTIGLLMDCDTTGIEPDFALVKFKKLAGGGYLRLINQSVPRALRKLGYSPGEIDAIVKYCAGHGSLSSSPHIHPASLKERGFTDEAMQALERGIRTAFDLDFLFGPATLGQAFCSEVLGITENDWQQPGFSLLKRLGFTAEQREAASLHVFGRMTVEGAPHLKESHLPVFDCASKCGRFGKRFLPYLAHIDMMAAAQPFLSGAISKTINMPHEAGLSDVQEAYRSAWQRMVKAVSIYRDGSKLSQPMTTGALTSLSDADSDSDVVLDEAIRGKDVPAVAAELARRTRRRELPKRRYGYTVKATVGSQRLYLRTGEYEDGSLGEIFVDMYKEGAAYRSLMNAFAIAVSVGLQYGVPLEEFVQKFHLFRFEPNGHVGDHDNIKFCSSVIDLIFRDLAMNYLGRADLVHVAPAVDAQPVTHAVVGLRRGANFASADAGLSVVSGGVARVLAFAGSTDHPSLVALTSPERTDVALTAEEWASASAEDAKMARERGYEGDPCGDCGQFTMVRSGTCTRCVSCGTTSGCS